MCSASRLDADIVLRNVVNGEPITEIAREKGIGYKQALYRKESGLQQMRTGGRCFRPWTHFEPGGILRYG